MDGIPRKAAGRRRHFVAGLAALALSITLVGCSSGTPSSPTSSPAKVDTTAAKAALEKLLVRPPDAPVTGRIGAPIPSGKTIDFISCGVSECNQEGDLLKGYAKALGWTVNVISTTGTPESQRSAFEQVVRNKSDAVIYVSINRETYASFIPQLQQNGTFTASICSADPLGDGIDYVNCTPKLQGESGATVATWIAADNGAGAGSLWVDVPAFPTLAFMGTRFGATVHKYCAECSVDTMNLAVTDLANASQKIVAYLRSHKDVKYVGLGLDSLAAGLPAALKSAGLQDVKIIGAGTGPTNLQYLSTGEEAGSAPFPFYEVFGAAMDAIARHEANVPQVEAKYPAPLILTKDNVDMVGMQKDLFPMVLDIQKKYFALWGK